MNNSDPKYENSSVISEKEAFELIKLVTNDTETLVQYELRPYSEQHIGFVASHCKLLLQTKCKDSKIKTHCLFVKTIPSGISKDVTDCLEKAAFLKETAFFADILPLLTKIEKIDKWAPTCYLVKGDTIGKIFFLL